MSRLKSIDDLKHRQAVTTKAFCDRIAELEEQLDIEIRERSIAEEKLEDAKSFAKTMCRYSGWSDDQATGCGA